jgi:hypothetical protein
MAPLQDVSARLLGTRFEARNCISQPGHQEPYRDIFLMHSGLPPHYTSPTWLGDMIPNSKWFGICQHDILQWALSLWCATLVADTFVVCFGHCTQIEMSASFDRCATKFIIQLTRFYPLNKAFYPLNKTRHFNSRHFLSAHHNGTCQTWWNSGSTSHGKI